jgi:hypothetical protein
VSREVRLTLEGDNVPGWAVGDQSSRYWYFENDHGEQWVAKLDGELLRISGLDVGWKQVELSFEQVMAERERLGKMLAVAFGLPNCTEDIATAYAKLGGQLIREQGSQYPLSRWIYRTEEILWLCSVLETAFQIMRLRQGKFHTTISV